MPVPLPAEILSVFLLNLNVETLTMKHKKKEKDAEESGKETSAVFGGHDVPVSAQGVVL